MDLLRGALIILLTGGLLALLGVLIAALGAWEIAARRVWPGTAGRVPAPSLLVVFGCVVCACGVFACAQSEAGADRRAEKVIAKRTAVSDSQHWHCRLCAPVPEKDMLAARLLDDSRRDDHVRVTHDGGITMHKVTVRRALSPDPVRYAVRVGARRTGTRAQVIFCDGPAACASVAAGLAAITSGYRR